MIKSFYLISFLAITRIAFSQEIPLMETFVYYENTDWTYSPEHPKSSFGLVEGNYIVFEFMSNNAGDPGNLSAGVSKLFIKVDSSLKKFELDSSYLSNQTALYIQLCRCPDFYVTWIEDGTIKGKKLRNGTWKVFFDVQFTGRRSHKDYHIRKRETFTFAELP